MTARAATVCAPRTRTEIGWGGETVESSPAAAGTMGSTLETLIQRRSADLGEAGCTGA
jgi:hypothetical protein